MRSKHAFVRFRRVALVLVLAALLATACSSHVRSPDVAAGAGLGPDAAAVIDDFFSGDYYRSAIIQGTERHVVTASTANTPDPTTTDIYTFEGDFADRGHVLCWVSVRFSATSGGGGAGCADGLDPPPKTLVGAGGARHHALLFRAPPEAAWFRVELSNGDSITTNVVERTSYASWAASGDAYADRSVALDDDRDEIWSEDLERPPPPPDVSGAGKIVQAVVEAD